ncbi:MAG: orotate phosphoribosyltransferase [Firmicutes bacterium]|nr:orotate phosphoribosyltransferase [Bacillota bacterium]
MVDDEVLRLYEDLGVVLHGHFLLTSGKHSPTFLQCSMVMQHPVHLERLCRELAGRLGRPRVECVAGPAMGGVLLAYEMARALGARAIYAEKGEGGLELRRNFRLSCGERCIVVEDAVTTGGSTTKVMELVRGQGAEVAGVGVLVDRSGGKVDFGVPFAAMLRLEVPAYEPDSCPLCAAGAPLTRPKSAGAK